MVRRMRRKKGKGKGKKEKEKGKKEKGEREKEKDKEEKLAETFPKSKHNFSSHLLQTAFLGTGLQSFQGWIRGRYKTVCLTQNHI